MAVIARWSISFQPFVGAQLGLPPRGLRRDLGGALLPLQGAVHDDVGLQSVEEATQHGGLLLTDR